MPCRGRVRAARRFPWSALSICLSPAVRTACRIAAVFDSAPPARNVARSRHSCSYSAGVGVISMHGFGRTAEGFGRLEGIYVLLSTLDRANPLVKMAQPGTGLRPLGLKAGTPIALSELSLANLNSRGLDFVCRGGRTLCPGVAPAGSPGDRHGKPGQSRTCPGFLLASGAATDLLDGGSLIICCVCPSRALIASG